jgi:uncharacterized MnhB-related membrane protein
MKLWKDVLCFLLVVVGAILFLYGANYYNAAIGWSGLGVFTSGFVIFLVLKACEIFTKKKSG